MSNSLTYRPDIDGLRAVAVLGVLFFHAGVGFPGGYAGVDVFFVISGFLITSLLLKDLRRGTFSLLDFWERRIRRILPALTVVVAAVFGAGWFLLLPMDYEALAKQAIALALFSSNIRFWRESGYFDTSAEEKPLLHTWSLSVEEQFYLFIPLLLALLFKWRRTGWCVPVLVIGALASFGLSVVGAYKVPSATFYLLPTRAWELAAGSLLAFAPTPCSAIWRSLASWVGLIAIALTFFLYSADLPFPGLGALPPVAGAALLIWAGSGEGTGWARPLPSRILNMRPLVWVGLLSYSLYLWHWPIFAFQKYLGFERDDWAIQLALAFLSVPLAWLSLQYVERPFRSRDRIGTRGAVFCLGGGTVATLVFLSSMVWWSKGAENRLSPEARMLASAVDDFAFLHELDENDIPQKLIPIGSGERHPAVFVWGDSHAMAALPAVNSVCRDLGLSGRAATASSTAPVLGWYRTTGKYGLKERAPAFNAAIFNYLTQDFGPRGGKVVILIARWESYLSDDATRESFCDAWAFTIQRLQESGFQVAVMKEVPQWPFDPPRTIGLASLGMRKSSDWKTDLDSHRERIKLQELFLKDFGPKGVSILDPASFLCDDLGRIRPSDNGGMLWRDHHHLSKYGSMRLVIPFRNLLDTLKEGGGPR